MTGRTYNQELLPTRTYCLFGLVSRTYNQLGIIAGLTTTKDLQPLRTYYLDGLPPSYIYHTPTGSYIATISLMFLVINPLLPIKIFDFEGSILVKVPLQWKQEKVVILTSLFIKPL